jgi:hypothetical protein
MRYGQSVRRANPCPRQNMIQPVVNRAEAEVKAQNIVVIYETSPLRECAMSFCNKLSQPREFSSELKIDWLSFAFLCSSGMKVELLEKAAAADLIIFAMRAAGDLPDPVKLWIENWLAKRGEREGMLASLLKRDPIVTSVASFREFYLRNVAHRAGMKYFCQPVLNASIPDSLDSFNQRAVQMTSVLDKILHTRPPVR